MDLVPPLVIATVNIVAVHDMRHDELELGLIGTPLVFWNFLVVAVHAMRHEELGLGVHLDLNLDSDMDLQFTILDTKNLDSAFTWT